MKECRSLSLTPTSPCRYFPQVLCLFDCHSSVPLSNAWSITRIWTGSTHQTQINLQLQRVSQSSCDYCLSAKCPLALNLCFLQWHLVEGYLSCQGKEQGAVAVWQLQELSMLFCVITWFWSESDVL